MQSSFKLLLTVGFHNLLFEITHREVCQSRPQLCYPAQCLFLPPTPQLISAFQHLFNGFNTWHRFMQRMVKYQTGNVSKGFSEEAEISVYVMSV